MSRSDTAPMMNRSDRLSFLARAAGASHQCGPPFPGRAAQERRANGAATELRRAALLAVQLQRSKRRRLVAPKPVEEDTEEGEGKEMKRKKRKRKEDMSMPKSAVARRGGQNLRHLRVRPARDGRQPGPTTVHDSFGICSHYLARGGAVQGSKQALRKLSNLRIVLTNAFAGALCVDLVVRRSDGSD